MNLPIFLILISSLTVVFPAKLTSLRPKLYPHVKDLSTVENKNFKDPSPGFRLPKTFIPSHYELRLRPILDHFDNVGQQWTAPGSVTILGTCSEATNTITLHSEVKSVNALATKVTNVATNEDLIFTGIGFDPEKTFMIIGLLEQLEVGQEYSIHIEFVADVKTDSLEGLYRSHYDDPVSGETKYLAATQFQAFAARRAFPCFDEPGLKATFKTYLGRLENYTALSNNALFGTEPDPEFEGWVWDEFKETVIMPTYDVAIVISDYSSALADPEIYPKPVKTWGPPHLIASGYGDYPSQVAAQIISFYGQFFDIDYALDKMDSVGLVDFAAGAMENYGLNIYAEDYLLYSPTTNDERDRRGVALTLSHELAHQWAGNLLTCEWWDMAWLNEGFATYLSYKGLERISPDFDPTNAILNDCVQNAMRSDVLAGRHPTVLLDDGTPWDIMSYDGNLVYSKGAALLRMIEGFLTMQTLQQGFRTYMKKYEYQGVTQDQFFEILTDQGHIDNTLPGDMTVKNIMDSWTLQAGYPLVQVSTFEDTLRLSDEEYRPDEDGTTKVYVIPVAIATKTDPNVGNTLPSLWLNIESIVNQEVKVNPEDWVVINSGATGYYRVAYSSDLLIKLQAQLLLDHREISLGSRSQLIDDYFTFAYDEKVSIETALDFTKYLANEGESSVWNPFFFHMRKPRKLLPDTELWSAAKQYMSVRLAGATKELTGSGVNVEKGAANLFLAQILDWACAVDETGCNTLSLVYFQQWRVTPTNNPIPEILRATVSCKAIEKGNNNENFEFAMSQFETETDGSVKSQIMTSLGCTKNSSSVQRLLESAMVSNPQIPYNWAQAALISVGANPSSRQVLLNFLNENFEKIIEYLGSSRPVANVIASLVQYLSSNEEWIQVDNFYRKYQDYMDEEEQRIVEGALNTIRVNEEWMNMFGLPMLSWFSQNVS